MNCIYLLGSCVESLTCDLMSQVLNGTLKKYTLTGFYPDSTIPYIDELAPLLDCENVHHHQHL